MGQTETPHNKITNTTEPKAKVVQEEFKGQENVGPNQKYETIQNSNKNSTADSHWKEDATLKNNVRENKSNQQGMQSYMQELKGTMPPEVFEKFQEKIKEL